MKRYIKMIAFLLVVCMFVTNINIYANVYALSSDKVVEKEHTFTKAELACMSDEPLEAFAGLGEEFIEINKIEGQTTRASTTYYIVECDDGYMLTSSSNGAFSRTRYNNAGINGPRKWIFFEDSEGVYIIFSYSGNQQCLTIDPDTKVVTLSKYTGSEFQKWRMYYSSDGNALGPTSTDSRVSGYKLVINSTSCSVSNSTYTKMGFYDITWYKPVTSFSQPTWYVAFNQRAYIDVATEPSDATISANWINWSTSNTKITVDGRGYVTGKSPGTATLSFTDKITRVTGSCTVTVMPIANGTYFLRNGDISDYIKVKNGTMTDGQEVVQYSFDGSMAERWIIKLDNETGYFSIKSANSNYPNYYMAISDVSTELNKPIVIRRATESMLTADMKWRFELTSSGSYRIISQTSNYVLGVSNSMGMDNAQLILGDFTNDCDEGEWILEIRSGAILEGQQWSKWCWATSARMFATNYYPNITRTQSEAVAYVKNDVINVEGSNANSIQAIEYYIGNISGATLDLQCASDKYSEEVLRHFLDDGHAIIMSRGWYTGTNRTGGHSMLITGYTSTLVDGVLQYDYIIYDPYPLNAPYPWDAPRVTLGRSYMHSYQWICNGQNALPNEESDNGIWDGYITVVTSYSVNSEIPDWN